MNEAEALQDGLSIARTKRLSDGRKSRATKRVIDWRANDIFFSTIVEIGKDLFVRKLSQLEIARKHQISRKTVWRYKKRLMRNN